MLIPAVEDGIEKLLRATLPLPAEQGDISFEAPSSTWSASVNRLTVNAYLFGIARSSQPWTGNDLDTYADEARFFSFRRATHRGEPDYGRQISLIGLTP